MRKFNGYMAAMAASSLIIFAVGLAVPASGSTAVSTVDFSTDPVANFAAATVADSLTTALTDDPNYAGVQITASGVELDYVGTLTPMADAAIARAASAGSGQLAEVPGAPKGGITPISVRSATRSLPYLMGVVDRLNAASPAFEALGMTLSSWGPDIQSDTVLVHLQRYTSDAAKQLNAQFGADVTVATQDEVATASGRTNDSAPWFGADTLSGPSGTCTSWFPSKTSSGALRVLTAGHCLAGTFYVGANLVGTTNSRAYSGNMDAESIPVGSALGDIYSDPTSFSRHITGTATSDPIGTLLCTDGTTDREVCSVKIVLDFLSVNYGAGGTITGLSEGLQLSNKAAFSGGDSGGPVEATYGSGQAVAYGMIVARVTSIPAEGFYIPARTINSHFGITQIT